MSKPAVVGEMGARGVVCQAAIAPAAGVRAGVFEIGLSAAEVEAAFVACQRGDGGEDGGVGG